MIAYRIDDGGQCQAVTFPTYQHLVQMVLAHDIHHILHHPPLSNTPAIHNFSKAVTMYVSPHHNVVFIFPLDHTTLTSDEIYALYRWSIQCRLRLAYPFLRKEVLPPETECQPLDVNRWCDTQIDAFTFFCIRKVTHRRLRRRKPVPHVRMDDEPLPTNSPNQVGGGATP